MTPGRAATEATSGPLRTKVRAFIAIVVPCGNGEARPTNRKSPEIQALRRKFEPFPGLISLILHKNRARLPCVPPEEYAARYGKKHPHIIMAHAKHAVSVTTRLRSG